MLAKMDQIPVQTQGTRMLGERTFGPVQPGFFEALGIGRISNDFRMGSTAWKLRQKFCPATSYQGCELT